MESFKHLGLSTPILNAITELGFEKPSEIQYKAIPQLVKEDRDFIGLAQTGTGKTAAFGLPLLERIDPTNNSTQALILAPTRELGQQIAEQINIFSKYQPKLNILAVYGGANIVAQIKALRQPQHIIIATPGRLIDLIKRKAARLDQIKFLVLDEADEMVNMGFKEELDTILTYTPEDKLTWLFSATMSSEIRRIVNTYMDNPIEVKIDAQNVVNANIEHKFVLVRHSDKMEALTRFLDANPDLRGVVFCRTKLDTQDLAEILLRKDYKADALHGDLSQQQRDRVMKRFKSNELQVLIATDVAARGIDVNDLTHVFHFSLPDDISYYTHRSGRTARAGKEGISVAFIGSREIGKIQQFAKQLGITFKRTLIPDATAIFQSRIGAWCEQILQTKSKTQLDPKLTEIADSVFGNLSKEELISKLLNYELGKVSMVTNRDLNESISLPNNDRDRDRDRDRRPSNNGNRSGGAPKKKSNASSSTSFPSNQGGRNERSGRKRFKNNRQKA